jgi:nitrous oxidase accessory protein NosD
MKKATALLLSLSCVLVSVSVALSAPLDLQALVDAAAVGDTLDLSIGHYGSARVDKALTIRGQGVGTVVDGGGSGHTLALMAAAISVENLRVTGSGTDVSGKHSGIWVDREADGARIIGVQIDRSYFLASGSMRQTSPISQAAASRGATVSTFPIRRAA